VLAGSGTASALLQGDDSDISAGGSGRLLFGRMFGTGDGLYLGLDVGGSAQFPKDAAGMRTSLELGVDIMAPVVYRHTLLNAFWEVEAGWVGHASERDWGDVWNGFHVGIAVGGRALRQRFFFPGAALTIAHEHLFLDGDDLTMITVGARVQFDVDL
jgi:hypothetical protein